MKHGIMISHKHSFYDYGINMVERKIDQPQKDDHTERVPYSNITYDFDLIMVSRAMEKELFHTNLNLLNSAVDTQLKN